MKITIINKRLLLYGLSWKTWQLRIEKMNGVIVRYFPLLWLN